MSSSDNMEKYLVEMIITEPTDDSKENDTNQFDVVNTEADYMTEALKDRTKEEIADVFGDDPIMDPNAPIQGTSKYFVDVPPASDEEIDEFKKFLEEKKKERGQFVEKMKQQMKVTAPVQDITMVQDTKRVVLNNREERITHVKNLDLSPYFSPKDRTLRFAIMVIKNTPEQKIEDDQESAVFDEALAFCEKMLNL